MLGLGNLKGCTEDLEIYFFSLNVGCLYSERDRTHGLWNQNQKVNEESTNLLIEIYNSLLD